MSNVADDFDAIRKALDALKCSPAENDEPACKRCGDGGWVERWSPKPPDFETCPLCYNPKDLPSP